MTTYKELLAQREALNAQIAKAGKVERKEALQQVLAIVGLFEFTPNQVFTSAKVGPRPVKAVAPEYRNPETGATWSGRGVAPTWIADKDRAPYLI